MPVVCPGVRLDTINVLPAVIVTFEKIDCRLLPAPVFENWLLSHLARARQPRAGAHP